MSEAQEQPPRSSTSAGRAAEAEQAEAVSAMTGAAAWLSDVSLPAFSLGLALVFVAERLLGQGAAARWPVSALGLLCVLGATAARFQPARGISRERRRIEWLMGALAVVGVAGVGLYFAQTLWLEPAWLAAGDGASGRGRWGSVLTVAWVSLLLLSLAPAWFARAAFRPMRRARLPELGRVVASASAGFAIAAAAIYLTLFAYGTSQLNIKADFSFFKTSAPSSSTVEIARHLSEPITAYAFFPEVSEARSEVVGYLRELASKAPKLRFEVHDRLLKPSLASKYRVSRDGTLVLVRGEADTSLFIGADDKTARPKLRKLDASFQQKLLEMSRDRRTAYFTVGHGELNDSSATANDPELATTLLRQLLQSQGYRVRELGLPQGLGRQVPTDASLVVVQGPTEPFAEVEITSLGRYLRGGGGLLLALDPSLVAAPPGDEGWRPVAPPSTAGEQPGDVEDRLREQGGQGVKGPAMRGGSQAASRPSADGGARHGRRRLVLESLNDLAGLAGLRLEPTLLASEQNYVRRRFNDSDHVLLVTNRFSSHAAVSTLSRNSSRAAVVFFGAGSLERRKGSAAKADFAVRSFPDVFRDANGDFQRGPDERAGAYNLAAAITIPVGEQAASEPAGERATEAQPSDGAEEGRAFVIADAECLSDLVLARAVPNQLLAMDVVRWLGNEESYAGALSNEEDVRIEHSKQQDLVWFYGSIIGAPALALGLGLALSRRRRRRRRS